MKKFTALLLTAAMVVTMFVVAPLAVSAADAIGAKDAGKASGTPEGTAITAWTDITDLTGKYYLTADITAGSTLGEFKGTLDGNGKTITATAPLFETLTGATIKNLTVNSTATAPSSLEAKDPDNNASSALGALAVLGSDVTISNVKANVNFVVTECTNKAIVSGMIGNITAGAASFENCEVTGKIESKDYANGFALVVGGTTVTVTNCTNAAEVIGHGNKTSGFFGDTRCSSAIFTNCLNSGKLTVVSNSGAYVGYAAGAVTITNSKNTGNIAIDEAYTNNSCVGGFVGKSNGNLEITDCTNSGNITYPLGESAPAPSGENATGGIVGTKRNGGTLTIENCTNSGNINKKGANAGGIIGDILKCGGAIVIKDCKNTGSVTTTQSRPAGIVACLDGDTSSPSILITNCTNSGAITCTDPAKDCAAGIIAYPNANLKADPCTFEISNCTNTGAIDGGKDKAGGVIGYVNLTGAANATFTIKDCTNKGTVTSKDSNCIAGICGQFKANCDGKLTTTMTNCDNSGVVTQTSATVEARTAGIIGNLEYGSGKALTGKFVIDGCDNKADVNAAGYSAIAGIVARTVAIATAPVEIKNCYNSGKLTDTDTNGIMGADGLTPDETKVSAFYGVAPEAENLTITSSACKHQALCTAPTECILCHATEGVTEPTLVHTYDETGKCACGAEKPADEPDEPLGDATIWVLAISMIALLGTAITVSVKRRA